MEIKTSVVILNWNGKAYLEKFLPFLRKHTESPETEIIVADNGSSDNSVEFLKENYPQIRLILFDKNYGFAEGYNKAMEQVKSEYVVLLNSDIEVTENWLQPLISEMDKNKKMAAAMPKILSFTDKKRFEHAGASGGFIDKYGYPFCRGRILDNLENDEGQYDDIKEIFWATGACMIIRNSVYKQMGGLDGDFFAHMEEIDLCWRMKSAGYSIKVFPCSKVYHVGGGTLNTESPFKLYLNYRNNLFMLFKNLPGKRLPFILFFRMVLDGVSGSIYLFTGRFKQFAAVLKSHFHFYAALPSLIKKRKQVQSLSVLRRSSTNAKAKINEIFNKSIVFEALVLKKNKFSDFTGL